MITGLRPWTCLWQRVLGTLRCILTPTDVRRFLPMLWKKLAFLFLMHDGRHIGCGNAFLRTLCKNPSASASFYALL